MIENSFLFLPGIGKLREQICWKKGILTWDDYLDRARIEIGINKTLFAKHKEILNKAKEAKSSQNIEFFINYLPEEEYWRLYKNFKKLVIFLDIESTGLSTYYNNLTIIGTYNSSEVKFFIKDINLDEFNEYIKDYRILVTFNGKKFDIPFILNEFNNVTLPPIHLDLRFLMRKIDVGGKQKSVEKKIGLNRDESIKNITGRTAAILWSKFLRNDLNSFRDLLVYNMYDLVNMEKIIEYYYNSRINEVIFIRNYYQSKLNEGIKKPYMLIEKANNYFEKPSIDIKDKNNLVEILVNRKKVLGFNPKKIRRLVLDFDKIISLIKIKGNKPSCVGIDLSFKRKSGYAFLKNRKADLDEVGDNDEIIAKVKKDNPFIISIDSPLSLPEGRCCEKDTCVCKEYGIMRECERILKRRGINVYPCLIQSMQGLTMRGIKLKERLEKEGFNVIESYPGAAQDILGFPRRKIDQSELEHDLKNLGIEYFSVREQITHDEIDALTSALVGYFYLAGKYEALGTEKEDYLYIPEFSDEDYQKLI